MAKFVKIVNKRTGTVEWWTVESNPARHSHEHVHYVPIGGRKMAKKTHSHPHAHKGSTGFHAHKHTAAQKAQLHG